MRLTLAVRELHPRRTFRIARARRNAVRNVYIRLEHDGTVGYGEASPNAFYNETAEVVSEKLLGVADAISAFEVRSVEDIERIWKEFWPRLAPSRAAQCALDLALWDWLGNRLGKSAAELAWGEEPKPITSFCTIGLSTPEEVGEKLDELHGFPAIKIKSDQSADLSVVRAARARDKDFVLAVDANCAWSGHDIGRISRELQELRVAFIEQPLPPEQDSDFSAVDSVLPIMADESCVTEEDVERVSARFAGFNIKLVKCGGLTPGLRMARRGHALGAKLMVGCMLESSALIAAGAVVAQRTHYADLDGAWLLGDDVFSGLRFERGVLHPDPSLPGLGIEPVAGLF
jgi:L-alanine-DL-glutamate epimerase-like enolase superfamily enzyme